MGSDHELKPAKALERAERWLRSDPGNPAAWRRAGACREQAGDLVGALEAYGAAHELTPGDADLANAVAALAIRLGAPQAAEALLIGHLAAWPATVASLNNLAVALRDQGKFDQAVALLQPAIQANPVSAVLWNTLASVLDLRGQTDQALTFYDEALRIAPDFANARYNRAMARQLAGRREGLIEEFDRAIAGAGSASEAASMKVARAKALLAGGRLAEGWAAYAARFDPAYEDYVAFRIDAPAWREDMELDGRRLLVVGEQGVGDEVMFAQPLRDLVAALGDEGRLTLAVDPRLVPLFTRSFPTASVGAHAGEREGGVNIRTVPFVDAAQDRPDAWVAMGHVLARLRPTAESFAGTNAYLTPDAARVAYWRGALEAVGSGPKIGLCWKSQIMTPDRARMFAPFEALAPVLRTPGARFVNLQYGDCAPELAFAARELGVDIWTPPGLDRRDDLDDLAALCRALDLVIGPLNATTNLAGAVGAPLWLVLPPRGWTRFGAPGLPWFPQARVFTPRGLDQWPEALAKVAEAMADLA